MSLTTTRLAGSAFCMALCLAACENPPDLRALEGAAQSNLIRLFPSDSPGQRTDAELLKRIFDKDFSTEVIETNGDPAGFDGRTKVSDKGRTLVNIFIEHVYDLPATKQAKHNWLSINQEFVDPPERLANIDVVLAKTKIGAALMMEYARRYKMKFKVYYTKFTSIVDIVQNMPEKDFGLAGHFAGKSPLKNTNTVLETWFANPGFPKLVATCRAVSSNGGCLPQQAQLFLNKHQIRSQGPDTFKPARNIELYTGFVDSKKLQTWQNSAAYYIVPSAAEGYGHYINEGRARGAVVITTDAPPMNEMVRNGVSGFVVPAKSSEVINPYTKALRYEIDPDELAKVVKRVLALPEKTKLEIGERSRREYLEDTRFFEQKMKAMADSLKEKGDLSLMPTDVFDRL